MSHEYFLLKKYGTKYQGAERARTYFILRVVSSYTFQGIESHTLEKRMKNNTSLNAITNRQPLINNAVQASCSLFKMSILLDKLQALNYEEKFCKEISSDHQIFNKEYFVFPQNNTIAQFQQFTLLVTWLFNTIRDNSFTVDEFDDPNTIVHKIMLEMQILGFENTKPASQLKVGHGGIVLDVLNFVADMALEQSNFEFGLFTHPEQRLACVDGDDDFCFIDDIQEEEEEDFQFYVDSSQDDSVNDSISSQRMIESNINATQWKAELERIAPKLKAEENQIRRKLLDINDWRQNFRQQQKNAMNVKDKVPLAIDQLNHFARELKTDMNSIHLKENDLNDRHAEYQHEYVEVKEKEKVIAAIFKQHNDEVDELALEHSDLKSKLKELNEVLEKRGDRMTDTTPLMKLKDALDTINKDIKNFDLQIALLDNTITQHALRNPNSHKNQFDASSSFESDGTEGSGLSEPLQ